MVRKKSDVFRFFNKKKIKDVSREFDEFQVNTHLSLQAALLVHLFKILLNHNKTQRNFNHKFPDFHTRTYFVVINNPDVS